LEFVEVMSTYIAHTRAKTTHELENGLCYMSLVRYTTYDTFWYEFVDIGLFALEVAVS
jgi:hypothetical protein